jgi:hypothetical protein
MEEMDLILDDGEGWSMTLRDICHGVFLELSENVTKSLTKLLTKSESRCDVVSDVVLYMSIIRGGTDG